ncbi:uncharacterized protein LOC112350157 [Selaginella moellendorffii]|uniref:uncharacterized protein LOC112350157 n=1 Tax=Selaginella moellendorffii TaxID=88036 RepID=UPI000D1C7FDB|nr:uncharacterized protein LOC112350157 [Selaginella moellendorffii]|eukprot:XP_024541646.1 uncharacterized protein LOC112350157 [Selaginella moellendorffii]
MAADWQWATTKHKSSKPSTRQQQKLQSLMKEEDEFLLWPDHSQYAELIDQERHRQRIYVTKGSYFGQHRVESGEETAHLKSSLDSTTVTTSSSSLPVSWRTAGSHELAAIVSQRSGNIANCDLPPPSPEAHSSIKPTSCSSSNSPRSSTGPRAHDLLGEALCRSQTRAREAEKLAVRAFREKDELMRLFFREASMSLAYRQWLVSLQAENLCLRMCHAAFPSKSLGHHFHHHCPQLQTSSKRWNYHQHHHYHKKTKLERGGGATRPEELLLRCTVAFALGLGLAGAGFMLGWGMGWIFFAF